MIRLKHDDFNWKSIRFYDETLRFKREQTHELVHAFIASRWSVNGIMASKKLNLLVF